MNCTDFEKSFNEYVDDMLEPAIAACARRHVAKCPACDREVTRWQQTRILLSTAVSDFATAVDVSSLRGDVFATLGLDGAESRHAGLRDREAALSRGMDSRRDARGRNLRRAGRRSGEAGRTSTWSAAWRFASAATVSAATAAAAVLLLTPGPTNGPGIVASVAPSPASRSSYEPAAFRAGVRAFHNLNVAPATYSPPPLAHPEISHVDGLEAAPGHLVSTWVQPRTNARVIWVEDRGTGAPVRTAGLDR